MGSKYNIKQEVVSSVKFLSCSGLLPIVGLTVWHFIDGAEGDALTGLRLFGTALLSFLTGCVFLAGAVFNSDEESFDFKARGALWGSVLVFSATVGCWFLAGKVGLFVLALLYLLIWQIENKTSLSRLYPQWYWEMRTKLTMAVVSVYMLVWMTLPA